MLLEQPGGQIAAQFTGPFFALVEGNQLVLVRGGEHEVVGGRGVAEKPAAPVLGIGFRGRRCVLHDEGSKDARGQSMAQLS